MECYDNNNIQNNSICIAQFTVHDHKWGYIIGLDVTYMIIWYEIATVVYSFANITSSIWA